MTNQQFIEARRMAIEREFSGLNDMQKQAVLTTEGPLLLLAGAGSGKTTVLINRIANLIKYGRGSDSDFVPDFVTDSDLDFLKNYAKNPTPENAGRALSLCSVEPVEPWRIIAITFTNKAADELKARLANMLGPEGADVWAMTFHSACVRILRRDIDKLGFERSFTIYDTSDSLSLMKRILKDLELDDKTFAPRSVLGQISRAKDSMVSAEDFCRAVEKSGDIRKRQIGKAYSEYSSRMRSANALDFDDLILYTVKLLLEYDDVREYYQRKFKYVLIDEYQDTNNLQYLMASTLAGGYNNICVVGDDDQSIYKFRGATIENILSFESKYKNARTIRLEQNYRSTGYILAASNDVISHNHDRKGKKLWTNQEMGEKPLLYVSNSERDEAQYIASRIIAGVAGGASWKDHAVLYRMNAQSNPLEYAFKRNGIPYRMVGGIRFFDRAEIKDMLAYLSVINNPTDDLRVLRVLNNPPRGIGQKTVETAQKIAAEENIPLYGVLQNAKLYPEFVRSAAKLGLFVELIEDMRAVCDTMPLDSFYDLLIERTGYVRMLQEKDTPENTSKIENVNELKSNIVNFVQENGGTLFDFLDEISLYTDLDQYDRSADCVVMMTMHGAKGLEFPTVFIAGAEEGIFPGSRSIGEPEEMEEERRLCYVAMTRAKKRLIITCARQRMLFGKTTAGKTSRFVDEIHRENINRPTPDASLGVSYNFEDDTEHYVRPAYTDRYGARTATPTRQSKNVPKRKITSPVQSGKPAPNFAAGDTVMHKAFGKGIIISLQPTGGDALVEIAFDKVGTKRLMLNTASEYMKKA